MLGEKKRVLYRYFNYIKQDAEDEQEAIKKREEEREKQAEIEQMRREREERLQEMGKR